MFGDYVYERSAAQYTDKILLLDDGALDSRTDYLSAFSAHGFEVVRYADDLTFRIGYEEKLRTPGKKMAVLARTGQYIPYDVRQRCRTCVVTLENLFPRLNTAALTEMEQAGLDLLSAAYPSNFEDLRRRGDTERFLRGEVYARENVRAYLEKAAEGLLEWAGRAAREADWFAVAEEKARLDVMAARYEAAVDTQGINRLFQDYVLSQFGKLSQNIHPSSPVLVSKALDYMHSRSDRFVVVVMDGMSEFDWHILSASFAGLNYEKTSMFAMIPSTTSVSRQCLLSGKYPRQLAAPWEQSREKAEFVEGMGRLGYAQAQIGYARGYDAQFSPFLACGAVIINDVDTIVHAQRQGRLGMLNNIAVLANQKRLRHMTERFVSAGFDVYITADHGNTPCTGLGRLMHTGVEVETRGRRMLVLKDFADKEGLMRKYGLLEYPKYYLPREYDYLICDAGTSFDAKGEDVMTHGGMTLDEVVVPFITIKAVERNG